MRIDPGDLPLYDHYNAGFCFGTLAVQIRDLLSDAVPRNFDSVALRQWPELPPRPLDDSLFDGFEQALDVYLTLPRAQAGAPDSG